MDATQVGIDDNALNMVALMCLANLPDDAINPMISTIKTGIYFGYAQVHPECPKGTAAQLPDEDLQVLPMVMSIGWNPFYKNEKLTAVGPSSHPVQYRLDDYCPSRKST